MRIQATWSGFPAVSAQPAKLTDTKQQNSKFNASYILNICRAALMICSVQGRTIYVIQFLKVSHIGFAAGLPRVLLCRTWLGVAE